jgi:hypothetical protein
LAFVVEAHRRKDILKVVAIKFELGPMCPSLKCNDYFSEWVEKHHRRPVMFKLALGTTRATSDLCFNIQFHRFDQKEAVVKAIGWYLFFGSSIAGDS